MRSRQESGLIMHADERSAANRAGDGATAIPMRTFRSSLPMALLRAREAVMNEFRPNLAENGINEQQWRVLRALASTVDDDMSVGQLADHTLLLGPSLSRILVKLEEQGVIERRVDDDDARRSYISINAAGLALVRNIAPQSESIYGGIEQRFGRERLAKLLLELTELTQQEETWQARQPTPAKKGRR
jgi:homoprotocatechuate degradation regulator HpaR